MLITLAKGGLIFFGSAAGAGIAAFVGLGYMWKKIHADPYAKPILDARKLTRG